MSSKKPALSTQVKTLTLKVVELEKKLKYAEDAKTLYSKKQDEAEGQIEQVHALLDVLPGAAGRKTEHEESYYRKDINVMTRLASYLASRGSV
jgi:hypothetical protein